MNAIQSHRKHFANAAAIITAVATAPVPPAGCNRDGGTRPVVSKTSTQSSPANPSQVSPPRRINVLTAKTNRMRREVELSGTVEGYETAKLMSKIDGYVGEVSVNIGDPVRQGDLLARLDLPELEDEVERRRRMVEQAEALVRSRRADVALAEARRDEHDASLRMRQSEQDRIARLVRRGSLSQQQLDEATYAVESVLAMRSSADANIAATKAHRDSADASLNVAKADLRKAELMARYSQIAAPFNGVITERLIDPGAFVRPVSTGAGTSMFTITRVDKVRIIAFLPMEEASMLDVGDRVKLLSVESLPDMKLGDIHLAISRVARSFDKESRMMCAEADVDNEEMKQATGRTMTPGDYIRLAVVLHDLENKIVVPSAAVGRDTQGPFVMLVDANNRCERTTVEILQRNDGVVAIESPQISDGATLLAEADAVDDNTQLSSNQIIRE